MSIPDDYLARIDLVHPGLAKDSVELNQEGMVNDVVLIDREFAFRFPKADWAQRMLVQEANLLDLIRPHLSVAIPSLQLHDDTMACYRWLPGLPLTRERLLSLAPGSRKVVLHQIGEFLGQLHAISGDDASAIPASVTNRSRQNWLELYDQVQDVLFPLLFSYQRESVRALFAPVISGSLTLDPGPVVIHGDIAPYHLLLDPATDSLSGVIDFGVGGLGDPANDIGLLLYNYGEPLVREICAVYPMTNELLTRARFLAGTLELQWALSGLRDNDKSLLVAHIGSVRGYSVVS